MSYLAKVAAALIVAITPVAASTAAPPHLIASTIVDPARDPQFPARNRQLVIRSGGSDMNALLFAAQGVGPKPTIILLHGLPGNERNLDLAQSLRRVGWNVLTFTYRGAWGSGGQFSLRNALEDAQAALDFARSAEGAKMGIDPRRIVIGGHSMGGGISMLTAARNEGIAGLVLLDAWNIGKAASDMAARGQKARDELIAGADDFGHALVGTTPASLADELALLDRGWNLLSTTETLRALPVLSIYATHGDVADNVELVERLKRAGNLRVTGVELDSDHAFADHRIKLAQTVADWLAALPKP
jgi:pimeloyl-ACP methyl ester carboxylesterase